MITDLWVRLSNGSKTSVCIASIAFMLSCGLICLVWIPTTLSAQINVSFRPMVTGPLVVIVLFVCFLVTAFAAMVHVVTGPRVLGLVLLIFSTVPFLLFRLITWLFITLRGIEWG